MKKVKVFISLVTLLCIYTIFAPSVLAGNKKSETIYAILDFDGTVEEIYVVNHLVGEYIDYGEYATIKNLSTTSEPIVNGDKISFVDEEIDGGLYYQGTIDAELPMLFEIIYYLDDAIVEADDLAGKSGRIKIQVNYITNNLCDENLRNGFMTQIAFSLNIENCDNIVSDGATSVVVGNTINLNHTIFSSLQGTIELEADVVDFEMAPISINLIKGTMSLNTLSEKLSGLQYGFDGTLYMGDVTSGIDEIIDGTSQVKNGTQSLVGGLKTFSEGLETLSKNGTSLQGRMDSFASKIDDYEDDLELLKEPSEEMKGGLKTLSGDGDSVAEKIELLDDSLASLNISVEQLMALATSFIQDEDPQLKGLAQSIILVLRGVDELSIGLSEASDDVDAYVNSVESISKQYSSFDKDIQKLNTNELETKFDLLKNNTKSYYEKVNESSTNIDAMYEASKNYPENISLLINGQYQLKSSLESSITQLFSSAGVGTSFSEPQLAYASFTSSKNDNINSVQYILTTPSIEINVDDGVSSNEHAKENLFTRLFALFNKKK